MQIQIKSLNGAIDDEEEEEGKCFKCLSGIRGKLFFKYRCKHPKDRFLSFEVTNELANTESANYFPNKLIKSITN